MLILGPLGMYFDAAVVFDTKSSLLFRLAVAYCDKHTLIISLEFFNYTWCAEFSLVDQL